MGVGVSSIVLDLFDFLWNSIISYGKFFVTGFWKAPRVPLVYPSAVAAKSAYSHTSTFAPGPNLSSSHSVVGKLGGELDANGRQRSWLISPCD